jgi:hypothetical protein
MIKMDCKDFKNNLFAYAEGDLPPEIRDAMAEHTTGCKSCSRLLVRFMALESAMEAEKAEEPNPFASTRILEHIESSWQMRRLLRSPVLRPVMITLALLAALVTGFLVGNHGMSRKSRISTENNQIEMLKSEFYVHDFVDEDITLLTKQ